MHGIAIFCHGPPGQEDTIFLQALRDLLVTQRMEVILMLNYLPDRVLDSERAVKQVVEADDPAVRQQDEFIGGGAADCGLVQVNPKGDLGTCEWLEAPDAMIQELALTLDQAFGDLAQRVPALLNAVNEELSPAGAFPDKVAVVGRKVGAVPNEPR
ncbi:MAG TPA: hypothetical protein VIR57_03150, partial [Chloroflexota bacterium]